MDRESSSAPIRSRASDPPEFDPREQRAVIPSLWDFEAAYGKATLRGRGWFVAMLTVGLLVVATNFYLGWRVERVVTEALASSATEHAEIVVSAQQTTCILALSQQGKLDGFMQDFAPDAWARYCWWIRRQTPGGGGHR